jgi:RNA polymerase sigma-70 factor, ECF subfamily
MQRPLFRFVRNLLGETEQAQDVVQDIFIDAWQRSQRGVAPFTADADEADMRRWLFHAAYHRAVSVLRRRRVIVWESLDAIHPPEPDHYYAPEAFEDRVVEGEVLRAALAALSPQDAACLLLNAVHGFSSAEIADILGIAPEASKKRLSRAKQRLRNAYFAHDLAAPLAAKEHLPS